MLLAVIFGTGGASSPYYTGLVLLFVGIPVLVPISGGQAAWIVTTLTGVFAGSSLLLGVPNDWNGFLLHLFFLSAAGFESVMSSALLDEIRFRDFVQRRELEQVRDDLRELDRAKSRFTANLHHELRTPLTLMLAPLEGIRSGEFGAVPEGMAQMVRTMHANGLRLLKLINNLLDLAKIESRELQVRRVALEPARMARDVVEGARGLAERKGVELVCGLLETVEGFHADPDALDKVLVNLVGNALKFTEAGGRIKVSVRREAEGARLTVADTGWGFRRSSSSGSSTVSRRWTTLRRASTRAPGSGSRWCGSSWSSTAAACGPRARGRARRELPRSAAARRGGCGRRGGAARGGRPRREAGALDRRDGGRARAPRRARRRRAARRARAQRGALRGRALGDRERGAGPPARHARGARGGGQRRDAAPAGAPAGAPLPGALGAERTDGARGGAGDRIPTRS